MLFNSYVDNLTTSLHLQGVADFSDHWHNASLDTQHPIWVILGFLSHMHHHHALTKFTYLWIPPLVPQKLKWQLIKKRKRKWLYSIFWWRMKNDENRTSFSRCRIKATSLCATFGLLSPAEPVTCALFWCSAVGGGGANLDMEDPEGVFHLFTVELIYLLK